jgi:glycosyltransferase involved in cell wall biosynthesis
VSDSPAPSVSVIIPCYNQGVYLDEAVESVLAQTYPDFEILVVDDGSTDPATIRLLDDYTRPKTTVFRTANQKLAAARNFLIARSRGAYLCALDADDKLHPQYLEKTVEVLERHPHVVFVSTRLQMFGAETRVWPEQLRCDLPTLLLDDPVHCAALHRRGAVLDVGGYDQEMPHQGNEDWDLSISLLEAGGAGVILPDVLFYYRRRSGSMCDACTRGQARLDLMEYQLRKHEDSYRAHAPDLLKEKDALVQALIRTNAAVEADLTGSLIPTIERRREELQLLKARLEEARRDASASTRAAYESAIAEVRALRASASWRITAPLRALYELLFPVGRRGGS